MAKEKCAVIVISSHVVRGTVGNRAAAFALEVMGYPVWIVPTVILPWHPGHGPAGRILPPAEEFDRLMRDLMEAPWLGEVGAVLSGYLGGKYQVDAVAKLIRAVKSENPAALYAMDPVMGDRAQNGQGRLYIPEDQAICMRDRLVREADLVTPNPFELEFLSGHSNAGSAEDLQKAAKQLAVPRVLVTSAPALMRDRIGNLLVEQQADGHVAHLAEHRLSQGPPNGLGDLAAALMLGNILAGRSAAQSLQRTSASLEEVMQLAAKTGSDELPLEAALGHILQPRNPVNVRTLAIGSK